MLDPISDEVLGSRAMFIDQLLNSDEPVGVRAGLHELILPNEKSHQIKDENETHQEAIKSHGFLRAESALHLVLASPSFLGCWDLSKK